MKNVPNSTQNSGTRAASLSTSSGAVNSDMRPAPAGGGGSTALSP